MFLNIALDLNRSQPPLLVHVSLFTMPCSIIECSYFNKMLSNYVQATNDTGILVRALPLAEVGHPVSVVTSLRILTRSWVYIERVILVDY